MLQCDRTPAANAINFGGAIRVFSATRGGGVALSDLRPAEQAVPSFSIKTVLIQDVVQIFDRRLALGCDHRQNAGGVPAQEGRGAPELCALGRAV